MAEMSYVSGTHHDHFNDINKNEIQDWSNQGLWQLEILPQHADLITLLADHNCLTKIDNILKCCRLQQLSLAHNRLLHISGLSQLQQLTVLNLSSNSICSIDGLEKLAHLTWLDLSGNNIKDFESLSLCTNLHHLDLSENYISVLADLHKLECLKTLLLHNNSLTSLEPAAEFLPRALHILSLEDNLLQDLTQVSQLCCLTELQQLSVARNPCVQSTADTEFDYRLYVLCSCPSLQILDGFMVTDTERQEASWLLDQGQMVLGHHSQLAQTRAAVSPVSTTTATKDENQLRIQISQPELQRSPVPHYHNITHSCMQDADASDLSSRSRSSFSSHSSTESNQYVYIDRPLVTKETQWTDFDKRSSNCLLQSESIYLPVNIGNSSSDSFLQPDTNNSGQQNGPKTSVASQTAHKILTYVNESFSRPVSVRDQSRVSCASEIVRYHSTHLNLSSVENAKDNKYELRDKRVIHPLNQEIHRGKIHQNFLVDLPQISTSITSSSCSKPAITAQSQDYDISIDMTSESFLDTPPVPNAHTTLIRGIAENKLAAREHRIMTHPLNVDPGTQANQGKTSKMRSKALNSNHQAELSKLVKCQQSAERLTHHRDRLYGHPVHISTDSGFQTRPASDSAFMEFGQEGNNAATCIQAAWRGYWAREYNIDVVSVRKEIRARRAEDHIILLRTELDRHKKLYNEEKRLRTLQMEAIRCLYREVQQLKSQMQQSYQNGFQCSVTNMQNATQGGIPLITPSAFSGQSSDLNPTEELERQCVSLQNQVWKLQEALQHVCGNIFHPESLGLNPPLLTQTDPLRCVQVREYIEENENQSASIATQGAVCHWSSIPHSLSPYPSEEEETYFHQVPHHGAPTPPRKLVLKHKGEHSVLLHWLPASVRHEIGDSKTTVIGYRVYVNDQVKGTNTSQHTMALVTGLCSNATYKFYVKAFSGGGESYESNIVLARLARGSERQHITISSDSDVAPDSDKDLNSTDDKHDKRRLRKRDSRKHRKVRSPRAEKKLNRANTEPCQNEVILPAEGDLNSQDMTFDGLAGIFTQPKIHKHRRTRSNEQNELALIHTNTISSTLSNHSTPSSPGDHGVQGHTGAITPVNAAHHSDHCLNSKGLSPSCDVRTEVEQVDGHKRVTSSGTCSTQNSLSDTFTIDKAKSYLHSLGISAPELSNTHTEGRGIPDGNSVKVCQHKSVQDHNSPSLDSGVVQPELQRDKMSPDRNSSTRYLDTRAGDSGSKIRTHRRSHSKDLCTQAPIDDIHKEDFVPGTKNRADTGSKEWERCSTPVLDGRKRTSSRPNSPMVGDLIGGSEVRDAETIPSERRRLPTSEVIEQRLNAVKKSTSFGSMSGREREEGDARSSLQSVGKHSPSSESLHDSSQDEGTRPVSLRRRTHSIGSESDLSGAAKGRREPGIVSLLTKLQVFTRSPENTSKETIHKRYSEEEERHKAARRSRHISESDNDMSSDPGNSLPPRVPAASDSSSGSHSDDNKLSRSHQRTHRRSPSDQRPAPMSGCTSDQLNSRPTHSPIIMEGAGMKKTGTNVRRNSSFHALLPSRPPDSGQPSPSLEEMTESTSTDHVENANGGSGISSSPQGSSRNL